MELEARRMKAGYRTHLSGKTFMSRVMSSAPRTLYVTGWSFTHLAAVTLKGSDCSHSQEKTEDEDEAEWGGERRPV